MKSRFRPSRAPSPVLLLAALTAGTADAASVDLLQGLAADGVFREARPLPAERLLRGERGYDLLPDQFGGRWSVVLGGDQGAAPQNLASRVHFSYLGTGTALTQSAPTIGKLLGRMVGRAAVSCFGTGPERLPDLKNWLEVATRAGSDTSLDRRFGPLRVQLLIKHSAEQAEVDVLMSRSGAPGSASWNGGCRNG